MPEPCAGWLCVGVCTLCECVFVPAVWARRLHPPDALPPVRPPFPSELVGCCSWPLEEEPCDPGKQ